MDKTNEALIAKVEGFVRKRLRDTLSNHMYFHDLEHTLLVVEGIRLIGRAIGLKEEEHFLLILAGFLHDVGYTEKYYGHEEESARIASRFLMENGLEKEKIELVEKIIIATKFPQYPENRLEQIICDADLYHFSLWDYLGFADRLKSEWETNLNLFYTDLEWDALNLRMLSTHVYFTDYGKNVLQQKKALNIEKLKNRIG
jgi:predicted metal-dependent HD superfamily phosphohydrolase